MVFARKQISSLQIGAQSRKLVKKSWGWGEVAHVALLSSCTHPSGKPHAVHEVWPARFFTNLAFFFNSSAALFIYVDQVCMIWYWFSPLFFPFSCSPVAQSILNTEFKKKTCNHPKKKGHLSLTHFFTLSLAHRAALLGCWISQGVWEPYYLLLTRRSS